MSQRPPQNVIGKRGVPSQDGSVRIGADHSAGDCTLSAVIAVANADFHRREGLDAPTKTGVAAVVFKAGQPLIIAVFSVPPADDLADGAYRTTCGRDIEQSEPSDHLVLISDCETVADDLVAGADCEDHGAAVDGSMESTVGLECPDGWDLGGVPPAHQG